MLNVTFVLCDHMLATSVSLPLEQLRAAESFAKANRSLPSQRKPKRTFLNVQLVSANGQSVSSHTGLTLSPDSSITQNHQSDIIYLPALWRNPKPILRKNAPILDWLKQQAKGGSLIAGVGTGCCFMAEAGLLDNKPATTHWHYFDKFQQWYPKVLLKRHHFITQANNLYCAGSVNSMADLTVHFIQRFFSSTIASHVERHFFHEIRRAYDSSMVFQDTIQTHPDEDIIQAQIWLQDNYAQEIKFQDIAQQHGMSMRNFSRRFKNATGVTPLAYLQNIRIRTAKDLLQTSNLSISEIIFKVGYHDQAHFTQLFKKQHGTTPSQYRTTVRAKLFSLDG